MVLVLPVGWMVFFQFLAGLSSVVSVQGPWYTGLLKSSLTPPGYVFGIVWTFLYMFLAVYAWSIWQVCKVPVQDRVTLQGVFVVQMLLNLSWSSVFFVGASRLGACHDSPYDGVDGRYFV